MIRLFILSLCLYLGNTLSISAEKIQFVTSLDQAKKLATEQQKVIFVDVMADWCGPCKIMMADIESNTSMVEYFNTHFINLKINEKYNKPFLSTYNIMAYPTIIFLTNAGGVIEQMRGYPGAAQLFKLAKNIQSKSSVYTSGFNADEETFDEDQFVEQVSARIVQMPGNLRKSYLNDFIKKGDPYRRAILEHYPSLIDFETFSKHYKKAGFVGDPGMTEKLLISFLFDNNNYFYQDLLRKEFKNLSKLTKTEPGKIAAFIMAYREFVLYRQVGIAAGENMLVYARSLLSMYPETKDIDLLHDAFIELIKAEKSSEFYLDLEPKISALTTTSDEFIYHDILSVIYAKTGRKTEAAAEVAAAMAGAASANKSYAPFLTRYRKEIIPE